MQKYEQNAPLLCPDKSLKTCPNYETMEKHFLKHGAWTGCACCCAGCTKKGTCEYTCDAVRATLVPAAPARTLEQIEADISEQLEMGNHMREMYLQAFARATTPIIIRIGECLKEEKEACKAAKISFADRIRERFGFSQRTAENYMTLAAEISPDSPIAQLPYTKALALTALPSGEREQFAADVGADNLSKKQLQDAIREKQEAERRAEKAEKAADTQRALAQSARDSIGVYKRQSDEAQRALREEVARREQAEQDVKDLTEQLQESRQPEVREVQVVPDDYEELKKWNVLLMRRVEEAENYAAEAEESMRAAQDAAQRAQMEYINSEQAAPENPMDAAPFADACAGLLNKLFSAPYSASLFAGKSEIELARYKANVENVLNWANGTLDALRQAAGMKCAQMGGVDYDVR